MSDPRVVLLRTSTLIHLFRVLATTRDPEQRTSIESSIIEVICDLIPCAGGVILLGTSEADLAAVAESRDLGELAARVTTGGMLIDDRLLAVPLRVNDEFPGFIAVNVDHPAEHSDTLSAIGTIVSAAVETARKIEVLEVRTTLLEEHTATGIVGESVALRRVVQLAERVAPQDTTVLILGESGTGKELIARRVHEKSRRARMPFVAINCAALTETLLESELFGHEKGAFTGASAQKKGKLEMAEGGTVFLDELGEMAGGLQAKLLRVLQQREFERVGGTQTIRMDVRIIAATNRDLAAEVKAGRFREDLYHRLNVVALRTPALRERREDVPALAGYFLRQASARCGRRVTSIAPEALAALCEYHWPGNVRELENAIERAVVLGDTETLLPEDLPETVFEAGPGAATGPGSIQSSLSDAKRESIIRAWVESKGEYKDAAQILGIHPNSLLRMIRNMRLRPVLDQAPKG